MECLLETGVPRKKKPAIAWPAKVTTADGLTITVIKTRMNKSAKNQSSFPGIIRTKNRRTNTGEARTAKRLKTRKTINLARSKANDLIALERAELANKVYGE